MLYATSSRRANIQRQRSQKRTTPSSNLGVATNNTNRPGSASSIARPMASNDFRRGHRPSTPYKNKDGDRLKEIQTTFLLTEQEMNDLYRAFCFMAKEKVPSPPKPRKNRPKSKEKELNEMTCLNESPAPTDKTSKLWQDKTVTLSLKDFFATFNLPNGGFYDSIFELVGAKNFHSMSFSEFLDGLLTYAFFKNDEMIRFVFFILDKQKEGKVPRVQLLRLFESLHHKKALMFQQAVCPPSEESSLVDFETVRKIIMDYPYMLEPAFRLQTTLRRRIMGEKFWKKKQRRISAIDKETERKRRREERRLMRERSRKIRQDVGWLSYYLKNEVHDKATREFPRPVVSIDESGEVKVDWNYEEIKGD